MNTVTVRILTVLLSIFIIVTVVSQIWIALDVKYVTELLAGGEIKRQIIAHTDQDVPPVRLGDGEQVDFPYIYRLYITDELGVPENELTETQKSIYHCIFTRSCDGYVREKHAAALLDTENMPYWAVPYIFRLCGEYVLEIIEMIYKKLSVRDNSDFKRFCAKNPFTFVYYYDRMISYWNEYYRGRFPDIRVYAGYRLFTECFGYTRSLGINVRRRKSLPRKILESIAEKYEFFPRAEAEFEKYLAGLPETDPEKCRLYGIGGAGSALTRRCVCRYRTDDPYDADSGRFVVLLEVFRKNTGNEPFDFDDNTRSNYRHDLQSG